jgi:DNA-binding XRE family transcriptional regulator
MHMRERHPQQGRKEGPGRPTPKVTGRRDASGGVRATLRAPQRLKAARRRAGLSQVALADAAGCHKSLIGALEVSRVDTVYVVLADAIALAVLTPTDRLFTVTGSTS